MLILIGLGAAMLCEGNFHGAVSQVGTGDFSADDRTAFATDRAAGLSRVVRSRLWGFYSRPSLARGLDSRSPVRSRTGGNHLTG